MNFSPDGQYQVESIWAGEIRFGPEYFRLRINGREIPHRIFGRPLTWSDDSSLCAAQEWLTTDYAAGPVTRAVLIKVASWEMATLPVVEKGFAESFQFDGLRFHYRKLYMGRGVEVAAAVELAAIHHWVQMNI